MTKGEGEGGKTLACGANKQLLKLSETNITQVITSLLSGLGSHRYIYIYIFVKQMIQLLR